MAVARPGTSVLELGGFLTPILPAGTTGVQVAVSVTLARTLDQPSLLARTLDQPRSIARTLKLVVALGPNPEGQELSGTRSVNHQAR